MFCNLCPRRCGVDRTKNVGRCRSGADMKICRIAPHYYEEPEISGTKGSGTIFFSGCSLDCEFCQNFAISKTAVGQTFSPKELAERFRLLEEEGIHNINLVTPTHFSDKICEALDIYRPNIPIVYNTSGYELPSVVEKLLPYVDIFLTDFKYGSDETAQKYSKVNDYVENCLPATQVMVDNKPLLYQDGLMRQGVIIRHLVLPDNLENTFSVIDIYKEHFFKRASLSIMSQFFPSYRSTIRRPLKPLEYKIVIHYLLSHGIDDCNIQELSSASESFVPAWDMIEQ